MKSLYIIRHGKSSWDDSGLPDVVRPLASRGRKASIDMGRHLLRMNEQPDLIISSPAARAYHTAVNMARELNYPLKDIRVEPGIYYGGVSGVIAALEKLEDRFDRVFTFGHEPTCSDLAGDLCGDVPEKFVTAAVYRADLDTDHWGDIAGARGKKIFFITPKQIKD